MIDELPTTVELPLGEIVALCRRRGVRRLALFGSVLRPDFGPQSDVDFLVEFEPSATKPWAAHLTELEEELTALLGRRVDVVDWEAVEQSRNPFRRHGILSGKRLVYAA